MINTSRVNDKIGTILICKFIENTKTSKTGRNNEKYLATNEINPELLQFLNNKIKYKATGKIDGTSAIIRKNDESQKIEIYKRRDIKQNREIPKNWIQTGSNKSDHLIGYMPLEEGDKWFHDCYGTNNNVKIITLNEEKNGLCYKEVDISTLDGQSVEIIGPKFQNNPHQLKMNCLMPHGLIYLNDFPEIKENQDNLEIIKEWFRNSSISTYLEGVVLHLENGNMYKLHRHHLNMEWIKENIKPIELIQLDNRY